MMSLGIMASAHNPASTLPSGPLAGTYLASAGNPNDAASHTFADMDIGVGEPTRFIVAVITSRNTTAAALASATIGGISATIATQISLSGNTVAIAYANIPSGNTATIVANWSIPVLRCGLGLWRITGGAVTVTAATASSATSPASTTVTGQPDGFIIAGSCATNISSYTWTGATERYDAAVESMSNSGADSTATGSFSVSAATAASSPVLATAAFAPA